MEIYIANNAEALWGLDATVEAEFGDDVAEGRVITLAHHGPRAGNECPCVATVPAEKRAQCETVGVSHFDLDTLGGVLEVLGRRPEAPEFWACAAHVDTHGPHRLDECQPTDAVRRQLHAFWAWSQSRRLFAPRDGSREEVTSFFAQAEFVLGRIMKNDPALIRAGEEWAKAAEALNVESLQDVVETPRGVVAVRFSGAFTNHFYGAKGSVCDMVVALNWRTGAVTLSRESDSVPVDCCEIMQKVFGPQAGGHAGIAGTPRGVDHCYEDILRVLDALSER